MIEKQNPGRGGGGGANAPLEALGKGNGGGAGPAGLPVFRHHGRINTASHVEFSQKAHESRRGRRHQVSQYFVGHRLVKCAAAAERPNIEFQGFQFDTELMRNVFQLERGEIRLSGLRAQAAKLRDGHAYGVVPFGRRVVECLEAGARFGHGRTFAASSGVYESDVYFTLRASSTATRLGSPK